jgi:hypothetical protein
MGDILTSIISHTYSMLEPGLPYGIFSNQKNGMEKVGTYILWSFGKHSGRFINFMAIW